MAPPVHRQAHFDKPSALHLEKGPNPFAALQADESLGRWAQDFLIAEKLRLRGDIQEARRYYKAASCLAPQDTDWPLCIDYQLLLLESLSFRQTEAVETFERSTALQEFYKSGGASYPEAYQDMLVMLADAYLTVERQDPLDHVLSRMPEEPAANMRLYADLTNHKIPKQMPEAVQEALARYKKEKLSPGRAAFFNAVLPGAGYYYLGQHQTALTSLVLNVATTAATVYFFERDNWGAGLLCATIECGWYFGGITGAYEEAYRHNHTLWQAKLSAPINQGRLAPALQLKFTF